MQGVVDVREASVSYQSTYVVHPVVFGIAVACLIWYCFVAIVCTIGSVQLWRYYSQPPAPAPKRSQSTNVTIIRPIKGLEPRLYDCLASTFRQDYPKDKLHVRFCVADRNDPSLPVVEQLLRDFPDFDAQLLIEDEDAALLRDGSGSTKLGPNPKIRNMSRAYREAAAGDIIWVLDCNVWVGRGVGARMVAKLEGVGERRRYKFVHQLPLVVDIARTAGHRSEEAVNAAAAEGGALLEGAVAPQQQQHEQRRRTAYSIGGGRMEEAFMSSAHAKFYTAINTVLIAPCAVGKSTMFRRAHLDAVTGGAGIDYFSYNICEDHLIGDIIWKQAVPEEQRAGGGEKLGKHALCFGDMAYQPMANMSLAEYWSRRVRWLRVRKFTVTLATFVEPGTESFLWAVYGAFALTTLPVFNTKLGIPHTWWAFVLIWLLSVSIWCAFDRSLYLLLQSAASVEVDEDTPFFARPSKHGARRPFGQWVSSWLSREALALPIWTWAFWGGTQVQWRGRKFRVGMDMKVHEIIDEHSIVPVQQDEGSSEQNGRKARAD